MRAMVLSFQGRPLELKEVEVPVPGPDEVLIKIRACGVCRTDLHIVDGELKHPKLPLIIGHEIAGIIEETGRDVREFRKGDRVGVPWLGYTCGKCKYCASGRENLCDEARFTGYTLDGGYAEYAKADRRFCFKLPERYDDLHAAPLLCAGLIGFRSYRMTAGAERIGIYGFGAAAHIIAQVAVHQGRKIYAFTKPGDMEAQEFAIELGSVWAGGSDEMPPQKLDAAVIFAPAGYLVPAALRTVDKGGIVVCGGIHMSDIPSFEYSLLWEERMIRSVANLSRADGTDLFETVADIPVRTEVTAYQLVDANKALDDLRSGKIKGAAVLVP